MKDWDAARQVGSPCDMPRSPANCKFDVVWSISSFEHDGLGRYGDPNLPDADLSAMRKLKGYVAPAGLMFLAVPVGQDTIFWNEGRVYGELRLPRLVEGWDLVGAYGSRDSPRGAALTSKLQPPWPGLLHMARRSVDKDHEYQPVLVLRNQ